MLLAVMRVAAIGARGFSVAEYEARVLQARAAMHATALDAVLVTTEASFRYLSGFDSPVWASPTRPRYLVVSRESDPVAVVPESNRVAMARTSWIRDVRCWPAPRPADDGISLVAAAIGAVPQRFGRIGAELGPETRLGMPVSDFLRLKAALRPIKTVDAGGLLAGLRARKSEAEITRLRAAAEFALEALTELARSPLDGASERAVHVDLQSRLLAAGADEVPYLVITSGTGGCEAINLAPSERRLRSGDVLFADVGARCNGYFSDVDRNWAIGRADDATRRAYDTAFRATGAGLAALRPGRSCAEVWRAMAAVLAEAGSASGIGRMGHGVGLLLTEPPSIAASDQTILEPGMVVTLEPGLAYAPADGGAARLMVHEEMVVVTEDGALLLTGRAPAELPVVA